ncbi:MAG TPA: T9SS type A sorting domain-containing protein, partial [Parafilimonas sp.]
GLGYSAKEGSTSNTNDGTPAYDLPSIILPVTFGNFTAQKQNNTSLLKWTTDQESNTDKFIVERSGDGRIYTSIGEVKAADNSTLEKAYQFIDEHPINGNNIYRIKEMDKEGRFNLSDLRSLNFADLKPYIQISPNPANNIVTIKIPGNAQNLTVRLLSTGGQLISNKVLDGETLTFDVSKLAAGVYNITIDGKGFSAKYKLVIQ